MSQAEIVKRRVSGDAVVSRSPSAFAGIPGATNVYIRTRAVAALSGELPHFDSQEKAAGYVACILAGVPESVAMNVASQGVSSSSNRCSVLRRNASQLKDAARFGNEEVFWCAILDD